MDIISAPESLDGGGGVGEETNIPISSDLNTVRNSKDSTHSIPNALTLNNNNDYVIIQADGLKDLEKNGNLNSNPHKKVSISNSISSATFNPQKNEIKDGPPEMRQNISRQVLASIAANMGAFCFGTVMAWSATGLASLHETQDLGHISTEEDSWIGSIALLGAVAACPFAGFGLVNLGRRKTMLFLTPIFILGWLLIAFANNLWMVILGKFITGICGGAFSVSAPIFTAETSDANIRGGLGSFFDLLLSVGMLYIYIIGKYVSWRWQAIACGFMPLVFHLLMYFVPESPRYLVEKEKTAKAEKAIRWLKKAKKFPEFVQWEISELSKSVDEVKDLQFSVHDALQRPIVQPTLILIGIMFFTTLSGVDAVVAYTVEIFESAGADMDPKIATIVIGITQVLSTIPAALIVDHLGRRLLLMVSAIFMCLSLVVMGFYFHVQRLDLNVFGTDYHGLSWMPLASLISFVIFYSFGFGPLSMMMIGEILPNNMKGLTSCIVLMSRWLLAFIVTYTFEDLKEEIHEDGTYWLFAAICFVGIFFVFFCIPETKGKSLDEIQIYFVKTKKVNEDIDSRDPISTLPSFNKESGKEELNNTSQNNNNSTMHL